MLNAADIGLLYDIVSIKQSAQQYCFLLTTFSQRTQLSKLFKRI